MSQSFELREGTFTLSFAGGAGAAMVWITGSISVPEPRAVLSPFLQRVHDAVVGAGNREVQIDLRKLEFINSSSIRPLVDWVWQVRELPPPRQYRLRFVTRNELRWQERLINGMSCFAPDLLQVDPRSDAAAGPS